MQSIPLVIMWLQLASAISSKRRHTASCAINMHTHIHTHTKSASGAGPQHGSLTPHCPQRGWRTHGILEAQQWGAQAQQEHRRRDAHQGPTPHTEGPAAITPAPQGRLARVHRFVVVQGQVKVFLDRQLLTHPLPGNMSQHPMPPPPPPAAHAPPPNAWRCRHAGK